MKYLYSDWSKISVQTQLSQVESFPGDRERVFTFFEQTARQFNLPFYFWNPGQSYLGQVTAIQPLVIEPTHTVFTSDQAIHQILAKFESDLTEGIFLLEGLLASLSLTNHYALKNAIATLNQHRCPSCHLVLWEEDSIELPQDLQPLIPQFSFPLPSTSDIQKLLQTQYPHQDTESLTLACQGLPQGEIQHLLNILPSLEESEDSSQYILKHKIDKLRGQGLDYIGNPDVDVAAGLDLLDRELDLIASLLSPQAQQYNLEFPKGMVLWGPPGTGKSLCAKLAARKMGIPILAADWGAIQGAEHPDRHLDRILTVCESMSPLILWFDDFDKGFAGWDSNVDGGIARRLSGKLLVWMQERTADVFLLATVNRLNFLPPELIRRFGRIIFVDLPHKGARYEIFRVHLEKHFPDQFGDGQEPWPDETWQVLLREYNLTTPDEIGRAVLETKQRLYWQHYQRSQQQAESMPEHLTLCPQDLLNQRSAFTPAMIRDEEAIWAIRNQASFARPANGPDRSRFAEPPAELFE